MSVLCTMENKSCSEIGQKISHQKITSLDFLSAAFNIQNRGVFCYQGFCMHVANVKDIIVARRL